MEDQRINEAVPALTWIVAEVVARCRQAVSIFTQYLMACVECVMAPFETLADAVDTYQLELQVMLHELRRTCRRAFEGEFMYLNSI